MSSGGGGFNPLGGIAHTANGLLGNNAVADAMGDASNAQLGQQRDDRALALKYANSPEEIQQLQQAVQMNMQDVARKQKLLDSSDPAFLEAGKQALSLMQGKQADALKPLQDQRNRDRQALQSQLQARLGPDYAQSSAGIQALNDFDRQSANLSTNLQQQTLGQFMGYAGMSQQFGNQQNNIANASGIANQYGNIAGRQMNAITGNAINPALGYAGQMANAQNNQQMIGMGMGQMYQNRGQLASTFGSMFGGGGGSVTAGGGASTAMAGGAMDAGGMASAAPLAMLA